MKCWLINYVIYIIHSIQSICIIALRYLSSSRSRIVSNRCILSMWICLVVKQVNHWYSFEVLLEDLILFIATSIRSCCKIKSQYCICIAVYLKHIIHVKMSLIIDLNSNSPRSNQISYTLPSYSISICSHSSMKAQIN